MGTGDGNGNGDGESDEVGRNGKEGKVVNIIN